MSSALFSAVLARRTHYGLSKVSTISDAEIRTIVETAVKHVPSPFNSQSGRVVILLGKESDKLWDIVKTGYLKTLGGNQDAIALSTKKIAGYQGGYGTILFFEDMAVVEANAKRNPALGPHFYAWSKNSTGMLQYVVWTALATEGMGASLQHFGAYSPEITENVHKQWKLPSRWKSTAMMPFGVPTGEPGNPDRPKTFQPIEDRVKMF